MTANTVSDGGFTIMKIFSFTGARAAVMFRVEAGKGWVKQAPNRQFSVIKIFMKIGLFQQKKKQHLKSELKRYLKQIFGGGFRGCYRASWI